MNTQMQSHESAQWRESAVESGDHYKNGESLKNMKNRASHLILILFLSGISIYAQDVITLRNGNEVKAKVTEINSSEIKYKRFDNLDGPTVVVPRDEVFVINYENGTREVINTVTAANAKSQSSGNNPALMMSTKDLVAQMKVNSPAFYQQYKLWKRMGTTGLILIATGGVATILGIVMPDEEGIYFVMGGSALAAAGTPFAIIGGVKKNSTVRNFSKQYYTSQYSIPHFQFSLYPDRVGLAYMF